MICIRKSWFQYKFIQFKHWTRHHYEYPMFLTFIFLILGAIFVQLRMNIQAIASFGFSLLYYAYCDYLRGDDVGWYRNKLKEKAKEMTKHG